MRAQAQLRSPGGLSRGGHLGQALTGQVAGAGAGAQGTGTVGAVPRNVWRRLGGVPKSPQAHTDVCTPLFPAVFTTAKTGGDPSVH